MRAGEVLAGSSLFSALPSEARARLVDAMVAISDAPGAVILREGDEADDYFLVAAGSAEVWASRTPKAARDVPLPGQPWQPSAGYTLLAELGPGDGFGEMALLLGGTRRATVRAGADLSLLRVQGDLFRQVIDEHRGMSAGLEEELALRAAAGFLGKTSAFAGLTPEVLRWLALRVQDVRFASGECIVRQGETGDALYVLKEGAADVLTADEGGERVLAHLAPGDAFGEQALITNDPRSATVRATQPAVAMRLGRDDFDQVLREHRNRESYFLQLTLQRQRPKLFEGCSIESLESRGETRYILKDAVHGRYSRLSEQGAILVELMDGEHTVRDLTMAYFQRYQTLGLDAVMGLMMQLHAAGMLQMQDIDQRRLIGTAKLNVWQRLGVNVLPWVSHYFSVPDADAFVTAAYRVFRPLFTKPAQALLLLVVLAGAWTFEGLLRGGAPVHAGSLRFLIAAVVCFELQAVLHELAHALTTKHWGREVHRAGVGWYLLFPVGFVDTSDMWLAPRLQRASVALAGPYTNFVLSGACSLALLATHDPNARLLLFQFALGGYLLGLFNLNPLLAYDGYYVLMDLLDVPNLRAKALGYIGIRLWRVPGVTVEPGLARVYGCYGSLALLYMVFVAYCVLTSYSHYLYSAMARVLPPPVALGIGYAVAAAFTWLVVVRSFGEVHSGAVRARRHLKKEDAMAVAAESKGLVKPDVSLYQVGGVCAIILGVTYVALGASHLLVPDAQQVAGTAAYFRSLAQDPRPSLIEFGLTALAAILAYGAMPALTETAASVRAGWVRWTANLAYLGFAVTLLDSLRFMVYEPVNATIFVHSNAAVQTALVTNDVLLYLDAGGILGFGAVGAWALAVNLACHRGGLIGRWTFAAGILLAAGYACVMGAFSLNSTILFYAGAVGGGVVGAPIWFIAMGRMLLRRAEPARLAAGQE